MNIFLIFSTLLSVWCVDSARILAIFQTPSKSHWLVGHALMKELASAGHKITVISPYPVATPIHNYRDIELTGLLEKYNDEKMAHLFETAEESTMKKNKRLYDNTNYITKFTLEHASVKHLMSSSEKFDLVILEVYLNDALLGFGQFYKCPVVGISALGMTPWVNELIGASTTMAHNPNVFQGSNAAMGFFSRMANLFHFSYERSVKFYSFDNIQRKIYQSAFPDPKPSFSDIRNKGLALTLLNSHFSSSSSQAHLPHVIEVGGMQINPKPNQLPKDIQHFIDESMDGVVYFSMGSNLLQSKMCALKRKAIINTFKNINLRVIWKFDDPSFNIDVHKVFLKNWLPQNDILAHPSVKVFITHGGWLSQTEALYHGVPIIGIPIFPDQAAHIDRAVAEGWGLKLSFRNLTEMSLTKALIEITDNNKYEKRAKELSQLFRDRPQPALDAAKFWVEFVLRHEGTAHLKSSAVHKLSFIRYHNLDIWLVILGALLLIIAVPICVLIRCRRKTDTDNGLLMYRKWE